MSPPPVGNPAAPAGLNARSSQPFIEQSQPGAIVRGTLTFKVTIPSKQPTGTKRYVSPATKGAQLNWTGPANGSKAVNLTSANKNCVKSGSKLVCTISVLLKPGRYTASVNLYDLAPVNGQIPLNAKLLSAANAAFSITSGHSTSITPQFAGVAATLSMGALPVTCTAIPATAFTVTAFDADGYTIVGKYAPSITLNDSDTSGATTLATKGSDNPPADTLVSSFDTATLAWNGSPIPGGTATIGAQAGSATTSGQFAPGTTTHGIASFSYTGGAQTFTVPSCTSTVFFIIDGAAGGSDSIESFPPQVFPGGFGGETAATIPVTAGESLSVYVGGAGDSMGNSGAGGFNGGASGTPYSPCSVDGCFAGAGGGGATDIRQGGSALSNRVVVAGGGGGAGLCFNGGAGGGFTGGDGSSAFGCSFPVDCSIFTPPVSGGGGTPSAGGTGGAGSNGGSSGSGGSGIDFCALTINDAADDFGSGGGGGGWFGGGGGNLGGAGGGGSAYAEPSATNVSSQSGVLTNSGNGSVFLCWGYSNGECSNALKHRRSRR